MAELFVNDICNRSRNDADPAAWKVDVAELYGIYGTSAEEQVIFLVAVAIAGMLLMTGLVSVAALVVAQVVTLTVLALGLTRESAEELHPYTLSILDGSCPELLRLQELVQLHRSRPVALEIANIISNMSRRLEWQEKSPIREQILEELRHLNDLGDTGR